MLNLSPIMLLLAASVAGCKVSSSETVTTVTTSNASSGSIAVHASGHPDANITSAGDLNIAGTRVVVMPGQRELLQKYYVITLMMRDPQITAGNADIAAHAQLVCAALSDLRATQGKQLASQLPAFQPYADTIDADQDRHCGKQRKL